MTVFSKRKTFVGILVIATFTFLVYWGYRYSSQSFNHTLQISDTNSHHIGNWYLKMNPKENDPHSADMVDYTFHYVYVGDSKAKYKIQVGNAIVEDKIGATFGEGGTVGSSFSKDVKQIELQLTTINESGNSIKQIILYKPNK